MTERARRWPWFVVAALALALAAAAVRLAWLSDDAYITLRSVENLLAGHGPVWNVGERVQTYTHPAWFWLLAAARWLTGEHFATTIALSLALAAAAVALLARLAAVPSAIAAVLVALLGSRAFGDYATSGLETPLAMLLLAWLARVDAASTAAAPSLARAGGAVAPAVPRLAAIAMLVGWCGLTRLDLLALAGPLLLGQLRRDGLPRQLAVVAAAMAPLLLWSLFAAWYYGSPFPITAYAKAFAPGIPAGELLPQGLRYVAHTLRHDPLTLGVIAAAVAVGVARRDLRARWWVVGIVASCAYVVRVGGDFMAGRFFVPAFVLALALLARWLATASRATRAAAIAAAVVVAAAAGVPPWARPTGHDLGPVEPEHGIQDERRFYYRELGLCSPQRRVPAFGAFSDALRRQGRTRPIVMGSGMAGGIPFLAGDLFHFVDPWLCDPLLMRLPVADPASWRIGHFTRAMPDGYAAALVFGGDRVVHPGLRAYYADLRAVLRLPLGDGERLRALGALWSGAQSAGLRQFVAEAYRTPPRRDVPLASLQPPRAVGTFWFDDDGVALVGRGGLRLRAGALQAATAAHVHVAPFARYDFVFRAGAREVGRAALAAMVDAGQPPTGDDADMLGYLRGLLGLQRFALELPPGLPAFDHVDVDVQSLPWTFPAIGGIAFAP